MSQHHQHGSEFNSIIDALEQPDDCRPLSVNSNGKPNHAGDDGSSSRSSSNSCLLPVAMVEFGQYHHHRIVQTPEQLELLKIKNNSNYVLSLPRDILHHLMSYLPLNDLCHSMPLVCHRARLVSEGNQLWLPVAEKLLRTRLVLDKKVHEVVRLARGGRNVANTVTVAQRVTPLRRAALIAALFHHYLHDTFKRFLRQLQASNRRAERKQQREQRRRERAATRQLRSRVMRAASKAEGGGVSSNSKPVSVSPLAERDSPAQLQRSVSASATLGGMPSSWSAPAFTRPPPATVASRPLAPPIRRTPLHASSSSAPGGIPMMDMNRPLNIFQYNVIEDPVGDELWRQLVLTAARRLREDVASCSWLKVTVTTRKQKSCDDLFLGTSSTVETKTTTSLASMRDGSEYTESEEQGVPAQWLPPNTVAVSFGPDPSTPFGKGLAAVGITDAHINSVPKRKKEKRSIRGRRSSIFDDGSENDNDARGDYHFPKSSTPVAPPTMYPYNAFLRQLLHADLTMPNLDAFLSSADTIADMTRALKFQVYLFNRVKNSQAKHIFSPDDICELGLSESDVDSDSCSSSDVSSEDDFEEVGAPVAAAAAAAADGPSNAVPPPTTFDMNENDNNGANEQTRSKTPVITYSVRNCSNNDSLNYNSSTTTGRIHGTAPTLRPPNFLLPQTADDDMVFPTTPYFPNSPMRQGGGVGGGGASNFDRSTLSTRSRASRPSGSSSQSSSRSQSTESEASLNPESDRPSGGSFNNIRSIASNLRSMFRSQPDGVSASADIHNTDREGDPAAATPLRGESGGLTVVTSTRTPQGNAGSSSQEAHGPSNASSSAEKSRRSATKRNSRLVAAATERKYCVKAAVKRAYLDSKRTVLTTEEMCRVRWHMRVRHFPQHGEFDDVLDRAGFDNAHNNNDDGGADQHDNGRPNENTDEAAAATAAAAAPAPAPDRNTLAGNETTATNSDEPTPEVAPPTVVPNNPTAENGQQQNETAPPANHGQTFSVLFPQQQQQQTQPNNSNNRAAAAVPAAPQAANNTNPPLNNNRVMQQFFDHLNNNNNNNGANNNNNGAAAAPRENNFNFNPAGPFGVPPRGPPAAPPPVRVLFDYDMKTFTEPHPEPTSNWQNKWEYVEPARSFVQVRGGLPLTPTGPLLTPFSCLRCYGRPPLKVWRHPETWQIVMTHSNAQFASYIMPSDVRHDEPLRADRPYIHPYNYRHGPVMPGDLPQGALPADLLTITDLLH